MKNSMLGSPVRCFGLCTQNHSFVGLLSCIYYSHFTGLKFHVLFLLHVKILKFCAFRMAKTIIDAILGLSFDDSTSNLAAAALFYVLTSDVSSFMFYTFSFCTLLCVYMFCWKPQNEPLKSIQRQLGIQHYLPLSS
jgi:hypothetical protein